MHYRPVCAFVSWLFAAAIPSFAQNEPPKPLAHFHHVHLNVTDPGAAIDFYASKFESEKRKSPSGADAIWAHKSWLFFNKVSEAPKSDITSAIWHIGWGGGANMQETYSKQVASGTKFQTPITDISDQCDGKGGNGRFFFSYVDGPEHALIELNTTADTNHYFSHVHLLSADPVAASEWYMKEFGLIRRGQNPPSREARFRCGRQTGPSVSMMMDDVSVIIYPVENAKAAFPGAWKARTEMDSSSGHSIDHLGFAVDNLDETIARLRKDGVKVEDARSMAAGKIRYAFLEGPDRIRLEIVEER